MAFLPAAPLRVFPALLPALLSAVLLCVPPAAAQESERSTFKLSAPDRPGTVLYTGAREEVTENGRTTERTTYSDPQGKPVQRTIAVFEPETLTPVSYLLEDFRSGEMEDLRRDGDTVLMRYREKTGADADEGTEDYKPGMLFSPTVVPFIKRNLARLQAGEAITFKFLVPSRQDVFTFRVQVDTERELGVPGIVIRMDPGTWLIRQLVDPLYFVLDAAPPHRTLIFQGRSSIKANDGKDQVLRYDYR